jgi:6-phosphogluconolactonase
MSDPIIRMFPSAGELAEAAAHELATAAHAAVAANRRCSVALSGGTTPRRMFRLLAHRGAAGGDLELPWEYVDVFWGDERFVPPDHPDSNFRTAQLELLSRVPIPEANVHRVPTELGAAEAAAGAYETELVRYFGLSAGQVPRFDLVFLGMGADGHTASLFPGTPALRERARLVAAVWVEKLDTYRVTFTYPTLNAAARVAFLVAGAEKAETLARVLAGDGDREELPARGVRPDGGKLYWLVDDAAIARWREKAGLARA